MRPAFQFAIAIVVMIFLTSCNVSNTILQEREKRAAEEAEKKAEKDAVTASISASGAPAAPANPNAIVIATPSSNSSAIVESAALKAELRKALPDLLAEGEEQKPPADLDAALEEMIAPWREADPNFFKVTQATEELLAKGRASEETARRRMEKTNTKAKQAGVEASPIVQKLMRPKDGKKLPAIRAELAAHILDASCKANAKAAGKKF